LRNKLWFLHGNLQTPKVWTQYKDTFTHLMDNGNALPFDVEMVDLWVKGTDGTLPWAEHFCEEVSGKQEHANQSQWLIGYSLGGRLALHAIVQEASLWAGAIIVGADPGFTNEQEKIKRLRADQAWGRRFLDEPWDNLTNEWDGQPIFVGRPNSAPRDENDFNRDQVSRMFDVFSNGRQQNLIPDLSRLSSPPILYVSGEEDSKYCEIGRRLEKECPTVTHAVIPLAAHRVPWENPVVFSRVVQDFIKTG
jgi:2-succinyl-6-hydroxy-2,4-cyclohexadiene-1-carboxylate synthase